MRTLVTGGGGFLGTHVVERLHAEGIEPIVAAHAADYDLTRWDDVERLFADAKPELVLHLAAEVGGIGANRANPGRYWYANLMMGAHVLEQSRLHGVDKLVVLGTVCAYPKFAPVPFREDDLWNGYPEETNAPYGVAKKALLVGAQAYREQYGLNAIFLLPVNLYGPRDNFDLETSHVIPALIRKMLEAQERGEDEVVLWGDGSPTREFLYVEDCAEAIVLAAAPLRRPEPVNLGTGEEISIKRSRRADRRGDGVRGRDRLGHLEAERPAAPQARHVAREGAVRVRGAHALPRGHRAHRGVVPRARLRVCGSLSGSGRSRGPSPGSSSRRSSSRSGSRVAVLRAARHAQRLALLPGRRPDVVLHARPGSSRHGRDPGDARRLPLAVPARARSRGSPGRTSSSGLPWIVLVQVLVLLPVGLLCAYGIAAADRRTAARLRRCCGVDRGAMRS